MVTMMSSTIQEKKSTQKRSTSKPQRIAILGVKKHGKKMLWANRVHIYSTRKSIQEAIAQLSDKPVWISTKPNRTDDLLREIIGAGHKDRKSFGSLFMLEPPRPEIVAQLRGCFDTVIGESPSFKLLPMEQLLEVIAAPIAKTCDLFIGGNVDEATGSLALVRGDRERLTVPLSLFQPSGTTSPDFSDFAVEDYGNTLRFGDYEAAADAVLWEVDAEFRKRAKAKERAHAQGLGPSIRRLRKQKGLSQSDFSPLTSKTIARIEQGDAKNPRAATLALIAETLGVVVKDIETY